MIRSQKRTNLLENNWTRPSKPAKIYTMEIEEINNQKQVIAEACENPLFIYYIKGYLSGSNCQEDHHNLLFGMAEGFMGRHEPIGEANYETSN